MDTSTGRVAGSSGTVASIHYGANATESNRPRLEITYTTPISFVPQMMIF